MDLKRGLRGHAAMLVTAGAVSLLLAAATSATQIQAKTRQHAQASVACSSPVTLKTSVLAAASVEGYMPISCEPVTESATAFGGVLVGAYAASYEQVYENPTLPAVVDDHGDAWLVTRNSAGASLEQVSASGTQLWATTLPATAGLVAGNSQVLVLKDSNGQFTIFNTATHQRTTISPPGYEQAQAGQINITTSVGVVGPLAILETSQVATNGQGFATQAGRVEVYNADGALVRAFDLPHKKVVAQPDQPNDSSRIVTFGGVAYLAWNDVPAGDQAGVFEITAFGQVRGNFGVPARFTNGSATEALALPNGRLLLSNSSTGATELVSVQTGGLHTVWRRIVYGGAARLGGAYIVTAGSRLREYRVTNGTLALTTGLRGFSLEPLVAGPFGVVAEGKSGSQLPQLVLISPTGQVVWRKTLSTGRMFPLPTTVEGNPAIYLGPNLPVVVWK